MERLINILWNRLAGAFNDSIELVWSVFWGAFPNLLLHPGIFAKEIIDLPDRILQTFGSVPRQIAFDLVETIIPSLPRDKKLNSRVVTVDQARKIMLYEFGECLAELAQGGPSWGRRAAEAGARVGSVRSKLEERLGNLTLSRGEKFVGRFLKFVLQPVRIVFLLLKLFDLMRSFAVALIGGAILISLAKYTYSPEGKADLLSFALRQDRPRQYFCGYLGDAESKGCQDSVAWLRFVPFGRVRSLNDLFPVNVTSFSKRRKI